MYSLLSFCAVALPASLSVSASPRQDTCRRVDAADDVVSMLQMSTRLRRPANLSDGGSVLLKPGFKLSLANKWLTPSEEEAAARWLSQYAPQKLTNTQSEELGHWVDVVYNLYASVMSGMDESQRQQHLNEHMMTELVKLSHHVSELRGIPQEDIIKRMVPGEVVWGSHHYHGIWKPDRDWKKGPNRYSAPDKEAEKTLVGVENFFKSAKVQEWIVFGCILWVFLVVQSRIYSWPSTYKFHALGLVIWLGLAAVCNFIVYWRYDGHVAITWFSGYLLEFVFSIENVFVFHIIVRAFRVPRRHAQKALTIVVISQLLFQTVFYMGLAYWLRASDILPYILGLWLLYLGYMAAFEGKHEDIVFEDTWVFKTSTHLLGKRLYPKYEKTVALFFRGKDGLGVTLLFIASISLVVVDFFLEVDVTLTKIEEMRQHYLAVTSSAAAAFAVPELFFVSKDLFARFWCIKYGIAFVLAFFGLQMLLHTVISIPTLFQSGIMVVVMLVCMAISQAFPKESDLDFDKEEEDEYPEAEDLWQHPPETQTEGPDMEKWLSQA